MSKGPFRRLAQRMRLGIELETHHALPLFVLLLLGVIWVATLHFIDIERLHAQADARQSNLELSDAFEAQMVRNLSAIDETLKMVRYAAELNGPLTALPMLGQQGLLPSSLIFVLRIIDRNGNIVASRPSGKASSMAGQPSFQFHQDNYSDAPFVDLVKRDAPGEDWYLNFSRRLSDVSGRFIGIVVLQVEPGYFTSGYERSRLGERGLLGLFGADGVFRAMRIGDKVSWGQTAPTVNQNTVPLPLLSSWDGVRRYTNVRRLHGFALSTIVGQAEDDQMADFEQHRRSFFWQAGSVSAVLVLAATLVCLWSWQLSKTRRHNGRAQETYAAASEASMDAFFVLRSVIGADGLVSDFLIDATNSRAEKLTCMKKHELCGQMLLSLLPEWRANGIFDDLVHVTVSGGVHEQEWENRAPGLAATWLHRQVVAVEGGIVAIVRDISERKRAQQQILHIANHDALTGLPNRSLVKDRIEQAILHAGRNGRFVSLAFIDLDGFKLVNDSLGHNAGDELLKIVSARMLECVRRNDTVGRFGGDEFVIIFSDQQEGATPVVALEKIRDALTQSIRLGTQEVHISCSIGVVLYPRDGVDPDALLMKADAAMYRAKELGRNNCQPYTQEMTVLLDQKRRLLEGLRNALANQQFHLLYQPKVDLRSGMIFGVEALIRWQHPEHGTISPLKFIPLAEESGLIVAIGEWVLETACQQNKAWQQAGLAPITMSVNVSPRQFEEKRLIERVAHALQQSGLGPDELELEVTESLIMRDVQQSIEKMCELKAMGVVLSIDDFGTGHSSMWTLKSFPVNRLKIDKSFVNHLADNVADQGIAMAIISLGHRLNLRVIAEGVETEAQRSFLRANDCDEMQGYLFSQPVPAAEIEAMLARQALLLPESVAV